MRYVSPQDGHRQDTASRYLKPLIRDGRHPNLHVLVETQAVRVLLDHEGGEPRAVGVEVHSAPLAQHLDSLSQQAEKPVRPTAAAPAAVQTIRARRLVILSCGSLGTPPVLERSGIGRRDVLERAGVAVAHELPGVGCDYQDHQGMFFSYYCSLEEGETLDVVSDGRWPLEKLIAEAHPILSYNSVEAIVRARPTEAELVAAGPAYQALWERECRDQPDRPSFNFALLPIVSPSFPSRPRLPEGRTERCRAKWSLPDSFSTDRERTCPQYPFAPGRVPPGQYLGTSTFPARSLSRGHVHITGPSTSDPLDFDAGMLRGEPGALDMAVHVMAYKRQRDVMRRMDCFRGEVAKDHPVFPRGSRAAVAPGEVAMEGPLGRDTPAVEYTPEDDAAIEHFVRERLNSYWHPLGTCRIGRPGDAMGVVDSGSLAVRGVRALKIVDLSVVPVMPAANTTNTTTAVAEKAAELFIRELRQGA